MGGLVGVITGGTMADVAITDATIKVLMLRILRISGYFKNQLKAKTSIITRWAQINKKIPL